MITILEIARESGYAVATVYNWAKKPDFPKAVKVAYHQKATYCRADVKAWLKKHYPSADAVHAARCDVMSTFAEYKSSLKHPQQLAHFELIAAALSLSGFCPQGRLIDICEQSGYSRNETRTLITTLVSLGLVEMSVTQEAPIQVLVSVCKGAELQGVLL